MKTENLFRTGFHVLANWKAYRYWMRRKRGDLTIDYERGCGFYLLVGVLGHSPIGKVEVWPLSSGRKGLYRLIDYEMYSDPPDMLKKSYWLFLGYQGRKPIDDCTFLEFIDIYVLKKV